MFRFVGAFSVPAESGWLRALYALLSAISVVIGVYLLDHPGVGLIVLTLTVGFFWIFSAWMKMIIGIEAPAIHPVCGMSGHPPAHDDLTRTRPTA